MKYFLYLVPVAILVAYSQLIVKWRAVHLNSFESDTVFHKIGIYLKDPFFLSAYFAALIASFGWLYIVAKLPLTIAFPVYIGITFLFVSLAGWLLLSETITLSKVIALLLIFTGIVIGVSGER